MLLSSLTAGQSAVITGHTSKGGMRRRLYELGFVPSAHTRCLFRSPLGDPAAYEICGTVIALRDRDAATILIKERDE